MGSQLIFVRHAHRDTSTRMLDNGLSDKGLNQVRQLEKQLLRQVGLKALRNYLFFSSPKRRCIETVFPLSALSAVGLKIEPKLNEQLPSESVSEFVHRVKAWTKYLTQLDANVLCCSHGDWLPEALFMLTGEVKSLKKGAFIVLDRKGKDDWVLANTILTES